MLTRARGCCACCRAAARCVWGRGAPLLGVVAAGVVVAGVVVAGVVVAGLPSRGSEAAAAQG